MFSKISTLIVFLLLFNSAFGQYEKPKDFEKNIHYGSVLVIFKPDILPIVLKKNVDFLSKVFKTNLSLVFKESDVRALSRRTTDPVCLGNIAHLRNYFITNKKNFKGNLLNIDSLEKQVPGLKNTIEYFSFIPADLLAYSTDSTYHTTAGVKCIDNFESILELESFHQKTKGENASLILFEIKSENKSKTKCLNTQQFEEFPLHALKTLGVIYSTKKINGCCPDGIAPMSYLKRIFIDTHEALLQNFFSYLRSRTFAKFGDIVLFEYELNGIVELYSVAGSTPYFDLFRIANCFGITVIEPAGNNSMGNPITTDRDSGAIIVGAAQDISDTRCKIYPNTGFGTRVDTYNLGNIRSVECCNGNVECSNCGGSCFCRTSAASAITAGFALGIQSVCYKESGRYLSPNDMREIFRNSKTYEVLDNDGVSLSKFLPTSTKILDQVYKKCKPAQ